MTIAEIHGKLPEYEGMEDLLTSDVFSTFKYVPSDLALIPFLKRAVQFESGETCCFSFDDVTDVDFIFWPKTSHYKREPDLLLLLNRLKQPPCAIVVEAKYRSGKSNMNRELDIHDLQKFEGDQLAEQYAELLKGNFTITQQLKEKLLRSTDRFLLFVTAHDALPKDLTNETLTLLYKQGYQSKDLSNLYWINWQVAWKVAKEALSNPMGKGYSLLLGDLKILLEQKGLHSFNGFTRPQGILQRRKLYYYWESGL